MHIQYIYIYIIIIWLTFQSLQGHLMGEEHELSPGGSGVVLHFANDFAGDVAWLIAQVIKGHG